MLSLDPTVILWTVVNLLVLYICVRKFLFGRINAIFEQRAKAIQEARQQAEDDRESAKALKQDYDLKLSQAKEEAASLVAKAKDQGQREYDAMLRQAREDASDLRERASRELAADREQMMQNAREEIAKLALEAAGKVLEEKTGDSQDQKLIDEFLDEAGGLR